MGEGTVGKPGRQLGDGGGLVLSFSSSWFGAPSSSSHHTVLNPKGIFVGWGPTGVPPGWGERLVPRFWVPTLVLPSLQTTREDPGV